MPKPTVAGNIGPLRAAKNNTVSIKRIKERNKKREAGELPPKQERASVRLGKTNTKILTGQEDISEWTDEELKAGKRFDKNGQNRGVAPRVVPKAIHDELVKRTLSKAQELLRENLEGAVEVLTQIADDPNAEDKDRLKAVDMIMNRVMGKTPEKVDVKTETPAWQVALTAGIVSIKGNIMDGDEEDAED